MLTNSLPLNQLDFKALEENIYREALKHARERLKQILETLDDEILKTRDKTKYRCVNKKATTLKTVMGEIEYSRRLYRHVTKDGKRHYIYLLNKHLGMNNIGMIRASIKIVQAKHGQFLLKTINYIQEDEKSVKKRIYQEV